jgi:hypothetical protein
MSHDTVSSPRLDRLNCWLIHRAARQAPQSLSERLEEEWLADLESRRSSASRLRFAIGCHWATRVISRDYQPAMAGAASSTAGDRPLSLHNDFGRFSKRSGTFFIVTSLHLALFYFAFTSLSHTHSTVASHGMEFRPVEKPPVIEHSPEVPRPQIDTAAVFRLEIPEVMIPADPIADPEWKSAEPASEGNTGSGLSMPQATAIPKRVAGGYGPGFPNTEDYYPSLSKILGEEGSTIVQVCVNAGGRLMADPTIVTHSGTARLDEAALRLATAGSGHYRPELVDGQPQPSCFPFRIRFQVRR